MDMGNTVEDSVDAIAADADATRHKYGEMLSVLLSRFESLDPEMAKRTIEALNDRRKAALWLATHHPCFRGRVPYQLIASGQRQDVLDVLGRIENGTFS